MARTSACPTVQPKPRLDKLGVGPGLGVATLGPSGADVEEESPARPATLVSVEVPAATPLVRVRADGPEDLARVVGARERMARDASSWGSGPKGRKAFREDDVRAFALAHGLVDVKVMAFDESLSGLKRVIPFASR